MIQGLLRSEDFAGGDRRHAGLSVQQQAALLVKSFEAAGELALGQPHADRLAEAGRALEPVGADADKALPALPMHETAIERRRERREQLRRA